MSNKIRLEYLEKKWVSYPAIDSKVLSNHDLKLEFSRLTSGGKLKDEIFLFAGRIESVTRSVLAEKKIEQFVISKNGEEFSIKSNQLDEESLYLLNEVLIAGDILLLNISWHQVMTSGLFPKIETMSPMSLKLLAPNGGALLSNDFSVKKAEQWELFLALVRKCFAFLHFTEVRTPTLVSSPGLEPFIDVFSCEFKSGKREQTLYLPTSPEFSLKKVLSLGHEKIFEFKSSFRNGELSEHHQPEFLMLEWYRAYSNLDQIVKDVKGLLNYLKLHWPEAPKGWGAVGETTIAQLFKEYCDFDLTPKTSHEELTQLASEMGVSVSGSDDWDEVFFKIFLEKIEPFLGKAGPMIVRNYPPTQAAWARITSQGWADRFEVYWRGVELANAFHELNDPVEQRKRFEAANRKREILGKPALPIDKGLIQALESGFPPSGGIALGLDRLFMLLTNSSTLSQTRYLPFVLEDESRDFTSRS